MPKDPSCFSKGFLDAKGYSSHPDMKPLENVKTYVTSWNEIRLISLSLFVCMNHLWLLSLELLKTDDVDTPLLRVMRWCGSTRTCERPLQKNTLILALIRRDEIGLFVSIRGTAS